MPQRKTPLITNEIYHVINRGVASQPIFLHDKFYKRFLKTMLYYQNADVKIRFSYFLRMPEQERLQFLQELKQKKNFLTDIIAYCFMPNHIHLLLTQLVDNGITTFMSNFTNSYTKYVNIKTKRAGPLFQGRFKAIRIETNEQLLHVHRYIHLNPYSGLIVKSFDQLIEYRYSSLPEYLGKTNSEICNKDTIVSHFQNTSYEQFIFDQADYQKKLQYIKHLLLE